MSRQETAQRADAVTDPTPPRRPLAERIRGLGRWLCSMLADEVAALERRTEELEREWTALDLGADCDAAGLRWTIRHLRGCIDQAEGERDAAQRRAEELEHEKEVHACNGLWPCESWTMAASMERERDAALRRSEELERALLSRHGGEPVELLSELDEARGERDAALHDLAAAREDTARLDWFDREKNGGWHYAVRRIPGDERNAAGIELQPNVERLGWTAWGFEKVRDAIDAARARGEQEQEETT